MPNRPSFTEPRLFDLAPIPTPEMQVAVAVNLSGPNGTAEVWVTISDLVTGATMACWSEQTGGLDSAPTCASEIIGDAVRTALRDLGPF